MLGGKTRVDDDFERLPAKRTLDWLGNFHAVVWNLKLSPIG
jgi:hypothetical protein